MTKRTYKAEYFFNVDAVSGIAYYSKTQYYIDIEAELKEQATSIGKVIPTSKTQQRHTLSPEARALLTLDEDMSVNGVNAITLDLTRAGWHVTPSDTATDISGIDIAATKDGITKTIEVKTERRIADTGNIYFELMESNPRGKYKG